MFDVVPYVVYFLGPFLLAFVLGKRLLGARYSAFVIGFIAFFIAWICVVLATQLPAATSDSFKQGTLLSAVLISASAGLFEESSRFFAFRTFKVLRERKDFETGIMYAIGHSGMESIIAGGSLLLTIAVLENAPELLPAEVLSEAEALLDIGFLESLYGSFERLFVGLLIHSCFTLVVLLALVNSQNKYLFLAMLWHFGHDMVAFNLGRLSEHWIVGKLWVGFIVVFYSWILLQLRRKYVRAAALETAAGA